MTQDEFVQALRQLVESAWDDRNYVVWFITSAALAGARLSRWIWPDK